MYETSVTNLLQSTTVPVVRRT